MWGCVRAACAVHLCICPSPPAETCQRQVLGAYVPPNALSAFLCSQDCDLLYMAFDIIHDGISSVAEKPLRERLKILERMVLPCPEGSESARTWGGTHTSHN